MRQAAFLKAALLLVALCSPSRSDDCSEPLNSATRLTIDSRRNDSGHWVSQVELIHGDTGERQGEAWTVDVHQRTSNCGGGGGDKSNGIVVVGATLVSPRLDQKTNWTQEELAPMLQQAHGSLRLHLSPLPWAEARRTCEAYGGTLADVTRDNMHSMHFFLHLQFVDMAYVGLRKAESSEHFVTVLGQPLETSDYVKWAPNHPDASGPLAKSACGAILEGGLLQDVFCGTPLPFFCFTLA